MSTETAEGIESLLARAREGDSRSVGVIFSRYRGLVESVCAARLGRSDLLADAVQEVFLKLMLSVKHIREPKALPGWLGRVARTTAMDLSIRESRSPDAVADPEVLDRKRVGASVLEEAVKDEQHRRVLEAVMELKPEFREVLLLRYLHSRSYREIAEVLGEPVSTIQVRLHRARRELAQRWRE